VPGSTADTEVAAQIAARTRAGVQRRQDFTAALIAQVGPDETERLLRRYPQPLEEISAPEAPSMSQSPTCYGSTRCQPTRCAPTCATHTRVESGEQRLRLFSRKRILLSDILPLPTHLGVEVTDERTHVIVDADGLTGSSTTSGCSPI
jgi:hypothetical protein